MMKTKLSGSFSASVRDYAVFEKTDDSLKNMYYRNSNRLMMD
jgi:hypothetical protein